VTGNSVFVRGKLLLWESRSYNAK